MAKNVRNMRKYEDVIVYFWEPCTEEWNNCTLSNLVRRDREMIIECIYNDQFSMIGDKEAHEIIAEYDERVHPVTNVYKIRTYFAEMVVWDKSNNLINDVMTRKKRREICDQVRQKRIKIGMSQPFLSELCGVPTTSICKMEKGNWSPSLDIIIRMCNALKLSIKIE